MRKVLEHLQQRPENERQAIAFLGAATVVTVLLAGWSVSSLGMFAPVRTAQTAAAADSTQSAQQSEKSGVSIDSIKKAYEAEVAKLKAIQQGNGR